MPGVPPSAIADCAVAPRAGRQPPGQQQRPRCRAARASARSSARCCSASSSVGAISAAWRPASTASARRERGDDRLAGADVALHQAQHRVRHRRGRARIFAENAPLRAGQRRIRRPRAARPRVGRARAIGQAGSRRISLRSCAQRQLVREQLLEREAALRGMAAGLEHVEPRVGRRAMHVRSASCSAGQFHLALDLAPAASPAARRRRPRRAPAP